MWNIRKFSLQSVLELMTTRMLDEVLTEPQSLFKIQICNKKSLYL